MKKHSVRHWWLLVALAGCGLAHAADEKLLAAARAAQPAVIDSLREMVLIESGSQDAAGLKRHGRLRRRPAARAGRGDRAARAGIGPGEMVKGSFTGTGKRNFMLIAHMDTVYGKGILANEPSARMATGCTARASPTTRAASR